MICNRSWTPSCSFMQMTWSSGRYSWNRRFGDNRRRTWTPSAINPVHGSCHGTVENTRLCRLIRKGHSTRAATSFVVFCYEKPIVGGMCWQRLFRRWRPDLAPTESVSPLGAHWIPSDFPSTVCSITPSSCCTPPGQTQHWILEEFWCSHVRLSSHISR